MLPVKPPLRKCIASDINAPLTDHLEDLGILVIPDDLTSSSEFLVDRIDH